METQKPVTFGRTGPIYRIESRAVVVGDKKIDELDKGVLLQVIEDLVSENERIVEMLNQNDVYAALVAERSRTSNLRRENRDLWEVLKGRR